MDRTRWIIFGVLCVALIGGLVFVSQNNKVDVSEVDAFAITTDREINDRVFGNPDSEVVVFEYADFQCPGCAGAYQNLQIIKEEYKDSIAFVYRHFPLIASHPHAFAAAAAAESAGQQGKFWEMHDTIYASQDIWRDFSAEQRQERFEQFARDLNLDIEKFNADLTSKAVADKINFDRTIGLKVNVTSTPSLYLNGEKVAENVVTDLIQQQGQEFRALLDDAIAEANGSASSQ